MDWSDESADEIRRAMRRTRARATSEIYEVFAGARELTDWRSYTRRHPWMTLASAVVAGYAIIPRRAKLFETNVQTLEDFARRHNHKLLLATQGARPSERGLLGALAVTLGTAALKLAASAAARELGRRWQVQREVVGEESVP